MCNCQLQRIALTHAHCFNWRMNDTPSQEPAPPAPAAKFRRPALALVVVGAVLFATSIALVQWGGPGVTPLAHAMRAAAPYVLFAGSVVLVLALVLGRRTDASARHAEEARFFGNDFSEFQTGHDQRDDPPSQHSPSRDPPRQ